MNNRVDLITTLEREARERSRTLENTWRNGHGFLLPSGFTDHYYPLTHAEHVALRRQRAAWALADSIEVCGALLQGEPVPRHRLNQAMLAAHERRQRGR